MRSSLLKAWLVAGLLIILVAAASAQDAGNAGASQSQSHSQETGKDPHKCVMEMQSRGGMAMGFSQTKTTHHFTLAKDGGTIRVEADDPKDSESRDEIRMHLAHIAKSFGAGDFDIPMFVHGQVPPGVAVMQTKKNEIRYRFKETQNGGQVVITSSDDGAVSAIHDFLVFQIREHKTGDSTAAP
jgi:hypothetical protein